MIQTNQRQARRGAALILVVFAVAFISVFAAAILEVATTDLAILRNHASGLKARWAAEAGLAEAIAALRQNCDTASTVTGTLTAPDGSTCSYSASVANARPVITVTSVGRAAGFTRKVQARLVVAGPPKVTPYPVRIIWWRETGIGG